MAGMPQLARRWLGDSPAVSDTTSSTVWCRHRAGGPGRTAIAASPSSPAGTRRRQSWAAALLPMSDGSLAKTGRMASLPRSSRESESVRGDSSSLGSRMAGRETRSSWPMYWAGRVCSSKADPASFRALQQKYRFRADVRTLNAIITPDNLDAVLSSEGLLDSIDLLSIDVDGDDYWIWRSTRCRPRVLVIEYNSALGTASRTQPLSRTARWDGSDAFGASLSALTALSRAKGFRLVHTDLAGVNAFFVREDLISSAGLPRLSPQTAVRVPNFGLEGRAHPPGDRNDWVAVGEDGEPIIDR